MFRDLENEERSDFMADQQDKELNPLFINEYEIFLKKHLFRLLGISHCELTPCFIHQDNLDCISVMDNRVFFSAQGIQLFWTKRDPALTDDNIRLAKVVIDAFFRFCEYRIVDAEKGKYNHLFEKQRRSKIYNMAIQVGICNWITGDIPGSKAEELFNVLEQWAVKTYEGKKVTMGFVIDPTGVSKAGISFKDWISFLEDDYSAVISDCIHSVFTLDKNCNFLGYQSISDSGILPSCALNDRVPLRFMNIIQQFVPKEPDNVKTNKVGIFLLSNGDILLAKDGATRFVKRNMQWLNLSYDAFKNALQDFVHDMYDESKLVDAEKLISSVYSSVLDVSFSHTGGIIAIVGPAWSLEQGDSKPVDQVLNFADNLLLDEKIIEGKEVSANNGNSADISSERERDTHKRTLKRKVIRNLVQNKKFTSLDRKLRSELIALDGACILDRDGSIYSFGAIIQNDSGSTGGARAAAAKKLSQYGMAVKVSTDGYIELYINSVPVYVVK